MQTGSDRKFSAARASASIDLPNERAPSEKASKQVFRLTYLVLLLAFSFAAFLYLAQIASYPRYGNGLISFYLVAFQDALWLLVAVLLYPLAWIAAKGRALGHLFYEGLMPIALLTLAVFIVTGLGTVFVYHGFALSMDEFMMRWQSQLLLAGYLLAPAPGEWLDLSYALRPGFLLVNSHYQFWVPGYRPGTALLHAGFSLAGVGQIMNATLAAASVLVLWLLARRNLPTQSGAVMCTVALFATAPQFLITGMTPYTMTAHLFATLLWLWLFMYDRPLTHCLAIGLGCYALGLHHIHVHSTMALPFVVHLAIVQKRWKLSAIYTVAYSAAALAWVFWIDLAIWAQGLESSPTTAGVPQIGGNLDFVAMAINQANETRNWTDLLHWAINATRLVAWQNLAWLPLFALALFRLRRVPLTLRLLVWSLATSLVPYILLMPSQGHGWGYRYLHQCLGHLALLAGFGWTIAMQENMARLRAFAVILFGLSCTIALPMRAIQTEAVVRPFANTMAHLRTLDADIVLLPTQTIWYGRDLVRNDALLRTRPVILAVEHVPTPELARLCSENRVLYLTEEALEDTGMIARGDQDGDMARLMAQGRKRVLDAGCQL